MADRRRSGQDRLAEQAAARLGRAWPDIRRLVADRLGLDAPPLAHVRVSVLKQRAKKPDGLPSRQAVALELGGVALVAKFLPGDLGRRAYELQEALWRGGFDDTSPYRVPEPIGYLPGHGLVLMRKAAGQTVSRGLRRGDRERLADGMRAAARWLVALHGSQLRVGDPPRPDEAARKLAHGAAKVTGEHRDLTEAVAELLEALEARLPPQRPAPVQVHFDYRPGHVLVSDDCVTVIDFNGTAPGEPGWDVARFVTRLQQMQLGGRAEADPTERAIAAFAGEYLRLRPEAVQGITYCWSYLVARNLLRALRLGDEAAREAWRRCFGELPDRVETYGANAREGAEAHG